MNGALICVVAQSLPLIVVLAAFWPSMGGAQGVTPAADDDDVIENIIVTGSRIKRRDYSSPSPLVSIDRADLISAGRATLEESLNRMPQFQPDLSRSVNNGGNGTSALNLRGIGAGRTLILINGRRFAPSGTGNSVDVNNIPQSLVERVEVITGGASTVYGSDAIAGVVNFILRNDFVGLSLDANYSLTQDGDSDIRSASAAFGHDLSAGRGNVTVYVGAFDREPLLAGDRTFTSVEWDNDDQTGELFPDGSPATPSAAIFFPNADLGSGPGSVTFDANGVPRVFTAPDDYYNFQPINYLQTPLRRVTAGILADVELGADYEIYAEASFVRNESAVQLAEVPVFTFAEVNTDNPVLSAEAQQLFADNYEVSPGMSMIAFGRRLSEVGPRIRDYNREYWRTVVGLRGDLHADWSVDAWLTYTRTNESENNLNDASRSRLLQGLLVDPTTGQCFDPSGGCVPVDVFGPGRISAEGAAFLRLTDIRNSTEREQKLASIVFAGAAFDTWAGPVDVAAGAEWRSDSVSFEADEVLFTGDTLGFRGSAPVEGTERLFEVFGEAVVPLAEDQMWARSFALDVGARYSDYELAGGVWTYKFGVNWQITSGLMLRGMRQHSVRAPNNAELFTEQFLERGSFVTNNTPDPCSASNDPVTRGFTEKCVIQGLPADQVGVFEAASVPADFYFGGNPALNPESADTLTLGVVIEPEALERWQFSIDYFDVELKDSIGDIDVRTICFDPMNTGNLFCDNMVRDAQSGFNVVEVFQPESNRGRITTQGIDAQVQYGTDLPDTLSFFGSPADLAISLHWTHTLENSRQISPVSNVIDCLGIFGDFCPIDRSGIGGTVPENRALGSIRYLAGDIDVSLSANWIDGTDNSELRAAVYFGEQIPLLAVPSIGARTYFDLGVGYRINDQVQLRAGVRNLTDEDPPLMPGVANNTDTVFYDVYGRSYFVSLSASLLK